MTLKQMLYSAMAASTVGLSATASIPERLTPEQLIQLKRVGEATLSPDGKTVVYTISQASIKDNKSSKDIYRIGLDGSGRKQLTTTTEGEHSPRWMKSGRISYMSARSGSMQLWSMNSDGDDARQLTDIEGGITGYFVSPDETKVLFVKEIKAGKSVADIYPDLPKASGRLIDDLMYKHWDEWVETIPHIFVATLSPTAPVTEAKDILEGEPFEAPMKPFSPIEDVAWSPDGKYIAYASRKKVGLEYSISTNSDIYLYEVQTGQTKNLTEGMMGYDTHPSFSPDGKMISWTSMERDGYEADLNRLFVLDLQTGRKTWLTEGFECNVDQTQWAADGKSIYFLSCVKAETHLHEVTLKGRKIRQITTGQYNYTSLQVERGQILAGRQSMLEPTDLYRVDLKTGQAVAITGENASTLARLGNTTVEKRWMKTTDGDNMLVWVVLPPGFDKTKKYPALLYCQGGPQNTVSQFFSYRWNLRLMAEQGYVVIAPNRHGVPSFGKAWNEQISGDYPGQNIRDYLTAVDEMKRESYIDPTRIGCVGASYGGFSTFYLAGHHDKRFAAFIAHAGIFNMEMQYLTTEEMWFANWDMGGAYWDKENKVAQRTFDHSPHKFVDKWDTPILVIHGEKDYRILADQGMAAFNAAKLRGIPSQLLVFPDENHWILQPQNSLLWQRTYFAWLDKWLKP